MIFLRVLKVSDESFEGVKYRKTSKNIIVYLLSNSKFHPWGKKFGAQN